MAVAPIRTHIVIALEGAVKVDKFRFGVGKGDVAHLLSVGRVAAQE